MENCVNIEAHADLEWIFNFIKTEPPLFAICNSQYRYIEQSYKRYVKISTAHQNNKRKDIPT